MAKLEEKEELELENEKKNLKNKKLDDDPDMYSKIPVVTSFPLEWYDPAEDAYWESYLEE